MAIRDRHTPVDSSCPHGGPPLSDDMMEWAFGRLDWFDKTAWDRVGENGENANFTVSIGPSGFPGKKEADFSCVVIGGIRSYVGSMIGYIKEVEKEFAKSPFPGIDVAELQGATISKIGPEEIQFQDGRIIRRKGMNWEWVAA